MAPIATIVVVVVVLLAVIIAGGFVISRGFPKDRDYEFEAKLFPLTIRFKVRRNDQTGAPPEAGDRSAEQCGPGGLG
jgi:hypothetical protein